MSYPHASITVNVDLTNPGQFFACCGLLELSDRRWPGAEGWFADGTFEISCGVSLEELVSSAAETQLLQLDRENDMSSPMCLGDPFELRIDWWTDETGGGNELKVWAGSMRGVRIARAMRSAMGKATDLTNLLNFATVVYDVDQPTKKVEPYYFDSRRGANAQSLDIGFAPDSLSMTTAAYPAVEFLCLVGLQRFRPRRTDRRRQFLYVPWAQPLPVEIAAAAAAGVIDVKSRGTFCFENAFRTSQRKHKSFLTANLIGGSK